MSYPIDLDDMPIQKLRKELNRRHNLAKQGTCAYCNQNMLTHTCKFKFKEEQYQDSIPFKVLEGIKKRMREERK